MEVWALFVGDDALIVPQNHTKTHGKIVGAGDLDSPQRNHRITVRRGRRTLQNHHLRNMIYQAGMETRPYNLIIAYSCIFTLCVKLNTQMYIEYIPFYYVQFLPNPL